MNFGHNQEFFKVKVPSCTKILGRMNRIMMFHTKNQSTSNPSGDHGLRRMNMAQVEDIERLDRLDAEELMHAALTASVTSLSSASPLSSQRRSRAPRLPPPQSSLDTPKRICPSTWKLFAISLLMISCISAGVVTVLEFKETGNIIPHRSIDIVTRSDLEVTLQITEGMQSHRIQQLNYTHFDMPPLFNLILEDFDETLRQTSERDVDGNIRQKSMPVHFLIPGSGQDTITHVIGACLGLTQGMDQTGINGTGVKHSSAGEYLMVDMQVVPSLNLNVVDILLSSSLHSLRGFLSNLQLRGKLVVVFRHPLERMLTLYYSSKDSRSSLFNPSLGSITLQEFATWPEDRPEFNFVTKSFLSKGNDLITSDQITAENFEIVKGVLHAKALILLNDDKLASWTKMVKWMNWNEDQEGRQCADATLVQESHASANHQPLEQSSVTSAYLLQRNNWDLQLFEFAVQLYQHQSKVLVN